MIIGYCRQRLPGTSSSLEAQTKELARMGAEKIFHDEAGLHIASPGLQRAISEATAGDVIAVRRAHHLALTSRGVMRIIKTLAAKGVGLRILDTPIDTSTTTGRMVLGSTPLWSLKVSPIQSIMADLGGKLRRS